MARRKYAKARKGARRVFSLARRGVRRASRAASSVGGLMEIGFSFGYGYARSFLTQNSIAQKGMQLIPFGGDFKDNIFLGLAAYLVNWVLKPTNAMVKLGLRTIVNSEAFLAGAKLRMGASISTTALSTSTVEGDYL